MVLMFGQDCGIEALPRGAADFDGAAGSVTVGTIARMVVQISTPWQQVALRRLGRRTGGSNRNKLVQALCLEEG
jgi:hypothetical protein